MDELYCQDEQKYAALYAEGTVRPEIMKLCFIGSEGAGKTTLMEALKRGWLEWAFFANENEADDPDCEKERTIGINVMTADISGVGCLSLWDFASQKLFHKAHGLFFSSNSFFIVLVSLARGKERRLCSVEELLEELQYWLSFLRASLDAQFIPTVLIAASRRDTYDNCQDLLERVVMHLYEVFKGNINIIADYIILDCRKSSSSQLRHLKEILLDFKQQFQKVSIKQILFF